MLAAALTLPDPRRTSLWQPRDQPADVGHQLNVLERSRNMGVPQSGRQDRQRDSVQDAVHREPVPQRVGRHALA